jgi:hypothetical protein
LAVNDKSERDYVGRKIGKMAAQLSVVQMASSWHDQALLTDDNLLGI